MSSGRDWLAFGVALYGAAVATGVAAYQFVRDRPGVKLILIPTNVPYDGLVGSYEGAASKRKSRDFWAIRVVNHRKRPITIRDGGLLGDRGQLIHPEIINPDTGVHDNPFPLTLTDGKSFEFYAPLDFERYRDRAGAWVVDDLDRIFKVHHPARNPRRRWREWRVRRRFEKEVAKRTSAQ